MNNDPYQRGYDDQKMGLGFLDNPYDSYSVMGRRWIDGYVKAIQDQRAVRTNDDP